MKKFIFTKKDPLKEIKPKDKKIFSFLNMYSLWLFKNEPKFRKSVSTPHATNFPDGKMIARWIRTKQERGPDFTRNFLMSKEAKSKKHFFIGNDTEKEVSDKIGISKSKIRCYNIPYIKNIQFEKKEIQKAAKEIKKFKPDFVWVCIGNPKQEILSHDLYKESPATYINVGAAMDFLMGKKDVAPKILRSIGIEWLYRMITDFKYSKRKAMLSLYSIVHLGRVKGK